MSNSFEVHVLTSKYSFILFNKIKTKNEINEKNSNIIIHKLDAYFHIKSMMMLKNINRLIEEIDPENIFVQPAGQLIGLNLLFSSYNFKNREKFKVTFQRQSVSI